MKREKSKADEEFGKAIADRLGLRHNDILLEWSAESVGTKSVAVRMEVFKIISKEEFYELRTVAEARAAE